MKCEECGNDEWEIVLAYVKIEEGTPIHLFQCKKCKRVVAVGDDYFDSDGVV